MEKLKSYKKAWYWFEKFTQKIELTVNKGEEANIYGDQLWAESSYNGYGADVNLPFSMLYGLLLEFLLENYIELNTMFDCVCGGWRIGLAHELLNIKLYKSMKEAQQAAIEKAFEILEKRLEES